MASNRSSAEFLLEVTQSLPIKKLTTQEMTRKGNAKSLRKWPELIFFVHAQSIDARRKDLLGCLARS